MFKNLLNMYLTITISLFILFTFHSLRAQNIDNVLGGSTANEGFFIINSNGDTVFTTRAHGKSGIGTTNPANLFEVVVPYSVIIGKEGIAGSTYSFGEIENSFNPSSPNGGAGIQVTDLSGMGKVGMTMELFGGQFGLVGNGGSVILQPSASNFNSQDYDLTIGPDIVHSSNLMVSGRKGVCFTGAYNSGQSPPLEGAGNRMMWYPNKAAFRVGGVDATEWDDGNIGWYSVATGYRTLARGNYSIAMGYGTTARGYASTAMGLSTVANGYASTAMGQGTQASGNHSTALGYGTIASGSGATAIGAGSNASGNASTAMGNGTVAEGLGSTAMGYRTIASADYSTGIGWFTNASGDYSISIGSTTEASGDYSTAMGNNVEISGEGSFIIGDHAVNRMVRSTPNRFFARFKNGYALYTNYNGTAGVEMGNNANSWSSISDSTKKENFRPVDGESVLQKISNFKLGTWNYKEQDPSKYRHYGPMAQDFFAAFGHDSFGTIGNDTTIACADFHGVNLIAIQALEKRTTELQKENQMLREEIAQLKALMAEKINVKYESSRFANR